ncbi:hypothetical protein FO521_03140 [Bacillus pseudomycoides]|nr:hypothetical protein [Bacillus pseudomycoides]
MFHWWKLPLFRYLRAVRSPPQNSVKAKRLGVEQLPVKARLVRVNNQWGMKKTPLIKVLRY